MHTLCAHVLGATNIQCCNSRSCKTGPRHHHNNILPFLLSLSLFSFIQSFFYSSSVFVLFLIAQCQTDCYVTARAKKKEENSIESIDCVTNRPFFTVLCSLLFRCRWFSFWSKLWKTNEEGDGKESTTAILVVIRGEWEKKMHMTKKKKLRWSVSSME